MFCVYPKISNCTRLTLYGQIPTNTNGITQSCLPAPPYHLSTSTTSFPSDNDDPKKTHLIGLQALAVIREHFASLGPQEMELDSVAV